MLVYEARVKQGFSLFCPTCYTDCGKRAVTDAGGNYKIEGLNSELKFTLLAMRDGYATVYLKNVDPAKGPAENAVLKPRQAIADPSQLFRGRVTDRDGKALRDAVVEQQGVMFKLPDGRIATTFGSDDWIEQTAVTNEKGEFELAYGKQAVQMVVQVNARGMAPKLSTQPTGVERRTLVVTDGATVRGRLRRDGKPVTGAELGLLTYSRMSGMTYPEARIGTQDDGTFTITNVPAGRIWVVYPKMASLASRGLAGQPVLVETKDDGQEIDLGDIELKPAYSLRGRVVLSDGSAIPPGMRVSLTPERGADSQQVTLDSEGRFEFDGLASGVYSVSPAVRGFRLPQVQGQWVEALVQGNVDNLVIQMTPARR